MARSRPMRSVYYYKKKILSRVLLFMHYHHCVYASSGPPSPSLCPVRMTTTTTTMVVTRVIYLPHAATLLQTLVRSVASIHHSRYRVSSCSAARLCPPPSVEPPAVL